MLCTSAGVLNPGETNSVSLADKATASVQAFGDIAGNMSR